MDKTTIACIGDSITWGFTILRRNRCSYPAVLQTLLGGNYEVYNFGYNDSTARMDSEVPYIRKGVFAKACRLHPDIAIIMLGSNDTKRINWDPDKFRLGYTTIVNTFIEMGSSIYLMLPPKVLNRIEIKDGVVVNRYDLNALALNDDTLNDGVIPIIREVAAAKQLPIIDINSQMHDIRLFNDGIHPNKEGAEVMARYIYGSILPDLTRNASH